MMVIPQSKQYQLTVSHQTQVQISAHGLLSQKVGSWLGHSACPEDFALECQQAVLARAGCPGQLSGLCA